MGGYEWEEHFQYQLQFFRDPRYITLNGKPLFIIYRPEQIDNLKAMLTYFKKRAIQFGFPGLEIMFQYPTYLDSKNYDEGLFDHYICFEPAYTLHNIRISNEDKKINLKQILKRAIGEKLYRKIGKICGKLTPEKAEGLRIENFDDIWSLILQSDRPENFIYGGFVNWDNTPRKKNGMVIIGSSPTKFQTYLTALVKKVQVSKSPKVIFINAWNEWGEGAYLEPDELYRYEYLLAIKNALHLNKNESGEMIGYH